MRWIHELFMHIDLATAQVFCVSTPPAPALAAPPKETLGDTAPSGSGCRSLPEAWRSLPAWRVAAGESLQFVELRRGEAQPPPDQLRVHRDLWLSLDGTTGS